ncbi:CLUMA_CG009143, isoform A [Clunio marinus]|uniref:CLUMA_CG009143, isoform A n=1 Tax=Clunio marinus TaxID=568069 RepID=A0A1J1I5W5_9DIPT|nr:CLUMA_CG009143, isoform A [Clunio marinus]
MLHKLMVLKVSKSIKKEFDIHQINFVVTHSATKQKVDTRENSIKSGNDFIELQSQMPKNCKLLVDSNMRFADIFDLNFKSRKM